MEEKNFKEVVVDELMPCPCCKSDDLVIVVSDKEETRWFAFCLRDECQDGTEVYSVESADDCADKWNEAVLEKQLAEGFDAVEKVLDTADKIPQAPKEFKDEAT